MDDFRASSFPAQSRGKELQESLHSRAQENSARDERPPNWRDHPVRSVIIASYKKTVPITGITGWIGQRRNARKDAFHDASWNEHFRQPRIPEGAVHLVIGDSLIRMLTRLQAHWQVGILSFSGAATSQMLASLEMLDMTKMYTVTLMIGTNDVSIGEQRKLMRLQEKMSCILKELRICLDPAILTTCTVP